MRLPANCPYTKRDPPRLLNDETIACCRLHRGWLACQQAPLCRSMDTEIEVYRLEWSSSFDGDALTRIGRQDYRISPQATYRMGSFSSDKVERDIILSMTIGIGCSMR
jgi:hypothetical protein